MDCVCENRQLRDLYVLIKYLILTPTRGRRSLVENMFIQKFQFYRLFNQTAHKLGHEAKDILNPACRRKNKRAYDKYKKNIAMKDCLQAEYSIKRQSAIALFFLYLWSARFFFSSAVRAEYYLGSNSFIFRLVCLFSFLTSSSTTRLYRGRAPRQSV